MIGVSMYMFHPFFTSSSLGSEAQMFLLHYLEELILPVLVRLQM